MSIQQIKSGVIADDAVTDDKLSLAANAGAIKTALNASGNAGIFAARAWVNFNGTGTVAIRASGNVSSITDLGTGQYTVNFTTAMPDANYAWSVGIGRTGAEDGAGSAHTNAQVPLAGSLRIRRFNEANSSHDEEFMCLTIFS